MISHTRSTDFANVVDREQRNAGGSALPSRLRFSRMIPAHAVTRSPGTSDPARLSILTHSAPAGDRAESAREYAWRHDSRNARGGHHVTLTSMSRERSPRVFRAHRDGSFRAARRDESACPQRYHSDPAFIVRCVALSSKRCRSANELRGYKLRADIACRPRLSAQNSVEGFTGRGRGCDAFRCIESPPRSPSSSTDASRVSANAPRALAAPWLNAAAYRPTADRQPRRR